MPTKSTFVEPNCPCMVGRTRSATGRSADPRDRDKLAERLERARYESTFHTGHTRRRLRERGREALEGTRTDRSRAHIALEPVPRKHLDDQERNSPIVKTRYRACTCRLAHRGR